MSSTAMDSQRWEEFLRNGEWLRSEYAKLIEKVRELEAAKAALEERLRVSEEKQNELQQKLSSAARAFMHEVAPGEVQAESDSKWVSEMKGLRSNIGRLVKDKES